MITHSLVDDIDRCQSNTISADTATVAGSSHQHGQCICLESTPAPAQLRVRVNNTPPLLLKISLTSPFECQHNTSCTATIWAEELATKQPFPLQGYG